MGVRTDYPSLLGNEDFGSTPNMNWVTLPDGRVGLLKPALSEFDIDAENLYFAIATYFGLDCSPIVKLSRESYVSLISYNKRFSVYDAYQLECDYSLQGFKTHLPPYVYQKVCLQAFVDAVCNNTDRHAGNLAFLSLSAGQIVDTVPSFDNVTSFTNSTGTISLLAPTSDRIWRHKETFSWLRNELEDYANLVSRLRSQKFELLLADSKFKSFVLRTRDGLLESNLAVINPLTF